MYECSRVNCDKLICACNLHAHKYLRHTKTGRWLCDECYNIYKIGDYYIDKDKGGYVKITSMELCDKENCCCH